MTGFTCANSVGCVRRRHGLGGECRAARLMNPRLCQLSDPAHPDYSPYYEALLGGPAVPAPVSSPAPAQAPSPRIETTTHPANVVVRSCCGGKVADPPRPTVTESIALVRLMKLCPHRSPCPACSHKGLCALGKGNRGTVRDVDCFACIRESGMEHPKKI
jgi:hypothetical protein